MYRNNARVFWMIACRESFLCVHSFVFTLLLLFCWGASVTFTWGNHRLWLHDNRTRPSIMCMCVYIWACVCDVSGLMTLDDVVLCWLPLWKDGEFQGDWKIWKLVIVIITMPMLKLANTHTQNSDRFHDQAFHSVLYDCTKFMTHHSIKEEQFFASKEVHEGMFTVFRREKNKSVIKMCSHDGAGRT